MKNSVEDSLLRLKTSNAEKGSL